MRISPCELHIHTADPAILSQVYSHAGIDAETPEWSVRIAEGIKIALGALPFAAHRRRRAVLGHLLSKISSAHVRSMIPVLVVTLYQRVQNEFYGGKHVDVEQTYSALAQGMVIHQCLNDCGQVLDREDDFWEVYYDFLHNPDRMLPLYVMLIHMIDPQAGFRDSNAASVVQNEYAGYSQCSLGFPLGSTSSDNSIQPT